MSNWMTPLGLALMATGALYEYRRKESAGSGLRPFGHTDPVAGALNGMTAGAFSRKGISEFKQHTVLSMDQRVNWIRKGARADTTDPKVVSAARWIVSQKCDQNGDGHLTWCVPPKDARAEADALYWAIKDPNSPYAIRYTNDHTEIDLFASTELMQRVPAEDCDGHSRALAAYAMILGFPVRFVVIEAKSGEQHIWTEVDLTKGSGRPRWYALDTTEDWGPGRSVPANQIKWKKAYGV